MLKPDAIEIHPCVVVGNDSFGNEIMEQCEEDDPDIACWALYFHVEDKGLVHVKDFEDREQAEHGAELLRLFMEAIQGISFE